MHRRDLYTIIYLDPGQDLPNRRDVVATSPDEAKCKVAGNPAGGRIFLATIKHEPLDDSEPRLEQLCVLDHKSVGRNIEVPEGAKYISMGIKPSHTWKDVALKLTHDAGVPGSLVDEVIGLQNYGYVVLPVECWSHDPVGHTIRKVGHRWVCVDWQRKVCPDFPTREQALDEAIGAAASVHFAYWPGREAA